MNILQVTYYCTLFVSLTSLSIIGCTETVGQESDIIQTSELDQNVISQFIADPPPPHSRMPLESSLKQLRQDSVALYDMYMEIAYPIRMTPVLLNQNTGYHVNYAFFGYFDTRSITEEGHVPSIGSYVLKNNVYRTPEHRSKIEDDLLSQLREQVPEESIQLLLSEYQLALDSIPINWNTISACLDISKSRFQLQRLPELLPLHKQVFDQARSYYETFDQFICYTIKSSLHAIAMHHSEEALQIVDAALNPDYWEEPDEEMSKKLSADCQILTYYLRSRILNDALPLLATDEEILEILNKWEEKYLLIANAETNVSFQKQHLNSIFNSKLNALREKINENSHE